MHSEPADLIDPVRLSGIQTNSDMEHLVKSAGSYCLGHSAFFESRGSKSLADKGKGRTGITLTHNRIQTRAEADGLRAAWGTAFDRLKSVLEGGVADAP